MRMKLTNQNCWPSCATQLSAGMDLRSAEETTILQKGERKKFSMGICAEIPANHVGMLFIRSGIGTKTGLKIANGTGIIDSDYRGEIIAFIENLGEEPETIEQYSKVVQLVIVPCLIPQVEMVNTLSETKRGDGGFGSSDIKKPTVETISKPKVRNAK